MVKVEITSNIRELQRSITLIQRDKLPSVMRNALNDVAMDARDAERAAIAVHFDRPNPLTKKAVVFPAAWKATKDNLEARIGALRDHASGGTPPANYLAPNIFGGPRRVKRSERAMRLAGILAADEYIVPAKAAPLDSYGNVRASLILQILSQLKAAETSAGYMANETARSRKRASKRRTKRYFVPRPDHPLPRGVYERDGRSIRAILIFVKNEPTYSKRYPFGEAAERAVRAHFERRYALHFNRIFQRA